jgi:hypothetical protein
MNPHKQFLHPDMIEILVKDHVYSSSFASARLKQTAQRLLMPGWIGV